MELLEDKKECILCNKNFSNKYNFSRHLKENNCKMFDKLSQYEIYKKFSNIKITANAQTQTEYKSHNIGVQTETKKLYNSISIQTENNIEEQGNKELYLLSNLKYNYVSFDDLKLYVQNYKYNTNIIYLSNIIKLLICNESHVENHIIKYKSINPPKFIFINENINNQKEILNLKSTVNYFTKHIIKVIKSMMSKFNKRAKDDEYWYDMYNDNLELLFTDLNEENNVEIALKNVLNNYILSNPIFKYA
jgi:hypothetical protein